jgi:hypothetical protein
VQERRLVGRRIGMDHDSKVRKIEAASGDIRRNADPRPAVPKGLEGIGSLSLTELPGQPDD